jgi:hypothetical protein
LDSLVPLKNLCISTGESQRSIIHIIG